MSKIITDRDSALLALSLGVLIDKLKSSRDDLKKSDITKLSKGDKKAHTDLLDNAINLAADHLNINLRVSGGGLSPDKWINTYDKLIRFFDSQINRI